MLSISRKTKNKLWHDRHSRKVLILLQRKNKRKKHCYNKETPISKHRGSVKAPKVFCIQENEEETIDFFKSIRKTKQKLVNNSYLFIDIEDVEVVGIDALMYLLALCKDLTKSPYNNIKIIGNCPKNKHAKDVFIKSGFLDYVFTPCLDITPEANNIRIKSGKVNDPDVAKEVCVFVQQECNFDKITTHPLYNILVELMGNTNQHAYTNIDIDASEHNWYLYAESKPNYISFVFLDTGLGIPATVYKKFSDRITFYSDSDYILSALNGDYRSETNENHRSKGLPQIADCCKNGIFKDVSVYAGKGSCYIDDTNKFVKHDLRAQINGTLFMWKIRK